MLSKNCAKNHFVYAKFYSLKRVSNDLVMLSIQEFGSLLKRPKCFLFIRNIWTAFFTRTKAVTPIFGAVMYCQLWKFLLFFNTFDNYQEQQALWFDNCIAAARPFFELFNSNCSIIQLKLLNYSTENMLYQVIISPLMRHFTICGIR